jgi:hypothetical protein
MPQLQPPLLPPTPAPLPPPLLPWPLAAGAPPPLAAGAAAAAGAALAPPPPAAAAAAAAAATSACFARSLVSVRMTLAPQFCASVRGITSHACPAARYGAASTPSMVAALSGARQRRGARRGAARVLKRGAACGVRPAWGLPLISRPQRSLGVRGSKLSHAAARSHRAVSHL